MPRQPIPERDPVAYAFNGLLIEHEARYVLAFAPLPEGDTILEGDFIIRYGFRYYGKPLLAIVPGIVALDYGDMLTGQEAWDFIHKKSNLYPRADVVGYRNDGQDEMIAIKSLDLAMPPAVLAYANAQATQAAGMVTAMIAANADFDAASTPANLLDYIPRYETITDWKMNQ